MRSMKQAEVLVFLEIIKLTSISLISTHQPRREPSAKPAWPQFRWEWRAAQAVRRKRTTGIRAERQPSLGAHFNVKSSLPYFRHQKKQCEGEQG